MRKAFALFLLLGVCCFSGRGAFLLFAQEDEQKQEQEWEDEEAEYDDYFPIDSDWNAYKPDGYRKGDQIFTLSLGAAFPLLFLSDNGKLAYKFTPPIGGAIGPLVYSYFFTGNFFISGEIAFNINATLSKSMLFMIPIGLRAGWQFLVNHFEFPVSLTVGMALHRYLNNSYVGMYLKGGVSGFYRFNPEWSFGMNVDWTWYPQFVPDNHRATAVDVHGNFLGVSLSARYHF